jgi:protein-L-isoaspartate(D-aspartate) O-methyltransferase
MLVTRKQRTYAAEPLMMVGFISCSEEMTRTTSDHGPSEADISGTRSVWLTADRAPDRTAMAVYDAVWFSSDPA